MADYITLIGEPEIVSPHVKPQSSTRIGNPIQVLLVEDDPEAAEFVKISLAEGENAGEDFQIEWVSNLVHALVRLSQPGIDVVVLDLGLPELTGYKSYRVIEAASGNGLPVVILTSDDSGTSKELTVGLGAADYLLKQDSTPALLQQALRNAVYRWRGRRL